MLCSVLFRKDIDTISLFLWLDAHNAFVENEECTEDGNRHKLNTLFVLHNLQTVQGYMISVKDFF